jgi:hypothetical protein
VPLTQDNSTLKSDVEQTVSQHQSHPATVLFDFQSDIDLGECDECQTFVPQY